MGCSGCPWEGRWSSSWPHWKTAALQTLILLFQEALGKSSEHCAAACTFVVVHHSWLRNVALDYMRQWAERPLTLPNPEKLPCRLSAHISWEQPLALNVNTSRLPGILTYYIHCGRAASEAWALVTVFGTRLSWQWGFLLLLVAS